MSFLSIVIPVYNEEDNIMPLFEKIHPVCETIGDAYEVLFVDDGRRDETFAVLSELSNSFRNGSSFDSNITGWFFLFGFGLFGKIISFANAKRVT